jgi:hypothetical protein
LITNKIIAFFLIFCVAIGLSSCENDLEVNAEYKEVIVVYGLLDVLQAKQYIKINKAYLSETNGAIEDAKVADSLYLDSVEAMLVDGNGTQYPLSRENGIAKESGIFTNEVNFLYTTDVQLDPDRTYTLKVKNPITKSEVSSVTKMVGIPFLTTPFRTNQFPWFVDSAKNIIFKFGSGENAVIYDVRLRFWYEEMHVSDTSVKELKYRDWYTIRNKTLTSDEGGVPVERSLKGQLLFDLLGATIEHDDSLRRRALNVDLEIFGGGIEISNYISISTPSIGIVQKQTDYTNIINGVGLFSSRNKYGVYGVPLHDATKFNLRRNSQTRPLNFID